MPEDHDDRDGFHEAGDLDDLDDLDDLNDFDDEDQPGDPWPGLGSPPAGHLPPAPGWRQAGGHRARRGLLLALTAVVAAAAGFGVVAVALRDTPGTPAASTTPSSAAPSGGSVAPSGGTGQAPEGGGLQSLPPGAMERLEIGAQVMAVSATSITLNGDGHAITAAVTLATTVTGKVTSIRGIKVGDFVSASISGANGKLTADSIQDPASLPSAPGQ